MSLSIDTNVQTYYPYIRTPPPPRPVMNSAFRFSLCSYAHCYLPIGSESLPSLYIYQIDTLPPRVTFSFHMKPYTWYSIVVVDHDSIEHEYVHWMVVNLRSRYNEKGTILSPFQPLSPPHTSRHRYECVVFSHKGALRIPYLPKRTGFSWVQFMRTHHLNLVSRCTMILYGF